MESLLRLCAFALAAVVTFGAPLADAAPKATSAASPKAKTAKTAAPKSKLQRAPRATGPLPWCAEEFETLPNGLCHIDGGKKDSRRTLVVFLHGAIAKDVDWQWTQERALARQARQSKFEAIFARAPLGPTGYVWPGTRSAQVASEQDLIDEWSAARAFLEARSGAKYDEVFLMGFSSGAYFVSSLVLRGRASFDGYAVFAGGSSWGGAAAGTPAKAPVYVGVCAKDEQTADHSRAFGSALTAHAWPRRIDEQRVGHMFSDVHVAHALAYLRGAKKP